MADSEAMCTVVVSLAPEDPVPLLLLGIRDEFTGRPWQPPARHWLGSPLIGGRDEQAGGTWLAVDPHPPRVACILNGWGEFAAPDRRRSRGELPLLAAAEGRQALRDLHDEPVALASYDPFYLVCAELDPFPSVLLLSWDGTNPGLTDLQPATHMLTNVGHMYPPTSENMYPPTSENQPKPTDEKARHFGPKFAATRPSGDPAAPLKDAWADWLTLAGGDDLAATEPGAIIVRRALPDGRVWGSTSATLIALARDGRLRYDFQPDPKTPPDPTTWYSVDTS